MNIYTLVIRIDPLVVTVQRGYCSSTNHFTIDKVGGMGWAYHLNSYAFTFFNFIFVSFRGLSSFFISTLFFDIHSSYLFDSISISSSYENILYFLGFNKTSFFEFVHLQLLYHLLKSFWMINFILNFIFILLIFIFIFFFFFTKILA